MIFNKIYYFVQEGIDSLGNPIGLGGSSSEPTEIEESLWDLVWGIQRNEFGEVESYSITGILIVGILLLLSILTIYVFIERYLNIRKALKEEKTFMLQIRGFMTEGNLQGAKDLCIKSPSPVARMIEKGIMRIGKPVSDIKASIENVAEVEIHKLENKISMLATFSGAAPMLGFLGTVIGMMHTFNSMKVNGVELNNMSGGMMEAMVTTVCGLIVGIISYVAYNFLVSKMSQVIHRMESSSIEFLDILEEPGK